jgi:hypothetical protein
MLLHHKSDYLIIIEQMTKQMMIDAIYEVIADKTLQFGCMYIDIFWDKYKHQWFLPYWSAEKIIW